MVNKFKQYLIVVLLCLAGAAQAQKEPEIKESYLKIFDNNEVYYCERTKIKILFSKKRIIVRNHLIDLDLKVTHRSKKQWTAEDDKSEVYIIAGGTINGEYVIMILPEDGRKLQYMISKTSICYEN